MIFKTDSLEKEYLKLNCKYTLAMMVLTAIVVRKIDKCEKSFWDVFENRKER